MACLMTKNAQRGNAGAYGLGDATWGKGPKQRVGRSKRGRRGVYRGVRSPLRLPVAHNTGGPSGRTVTITRSLTTKLNIPGVMGPCRHRLGTVETAKPLVTGKSAEGEGVFSP